MKLIDFKFELINNFALSESDFYLRENILVLEKFNFDYEKMLEIQNQCVSFVLENKQSIILIICSHPKVFTMGRGLQKIKDNEEINLVEFDANLKDELNFRVVDIKRGGGLTFHHEGQFVFYPILNTTAHSFKVYDLMIEILSIAKKSLEEIFPQLKFEVRKDLLGLWYLDDFMPVKVASIGLAVNRFVTYHGLALNFYFDEAIKKELIKVYPCGISGEFYKSISELTSVHENSLKEFKTIFMSNFYAIIERQRSSFEIAASISSIESDLNL